jgi:predicted RNase H-like nuclease
VTTLIVGVDGCRGGWVAVSESTGSGVIEWQVVPRIRDILYTEYPPAVVAIDIPIGLPDLGSRECDVMARRLLGRVRGSSVFPAPIRAIVSRSCYADANAARRQLEGKGMSQQAWAICPKIHEVDQQLRGNLGLLEPVHEVHPEVCFYHLAGGRPMQFAKKRPQGREERLAVLTPVFGDSPAKAMRGLRAFGAQADDVLDAFAALWTARRILAGKAVIFPSAPPRDAFGLPMRMVA